VSRRRYDLFDHLGGRTGNTEVAAVDGENFQPRFSVTAEGLELFSEYSKSVGFKEFQRKRGTCKRGSVV
jgi:hypothetical protein